MDTEKIRKTEEIVHRSHGRHHRGVEFGTLADQKRKQELEDVDQAQKASLQEKRQATIARRKKGCQSEVQTKVDGVNTQLSQLYAKLQAVKQQIGCKCERNVYELLNQSY